VRKYSLPWTHSLFQSATAFELLVEFYEDLFEKDPKAALEAGRNEDGEIIMDDTGDPLIDKWERELAMGLEPDLTEGLSDKERKRLAAEQAKSKRASKLVNEVMGIEEVFDSRLKSKFVAPNSVEERQLRAQRIMAAGYDQELDAKQLLGRRK
jgi:hypothetical protein